MNVKRDMVKKFEDIVYAGTAPMEMLYAVMYSQGIVGDLGMEPLGRRMSQGIGQGHPCAIP